MCVAVMNTRSAGTQGICSASRARTAFCSSALMNAMSPEMTIALSAGAPPSIAMAVTVSGSSAWRPIRRCIWP